MRAKILNASAGSGKTYRLAYKYVYDVLSSCNERGEFDVSAYRHILAVTFTNKATEEMKSRILNQINRLASGAQSDYLDNLKQDTGESEEELRQRAKRVRTAILHDYSRFTILTNDTFFQRILRAFVKELGIELNYSIELDTAPIVSKSVDAVIEEITENKELSGWIRDLAQDRIESGKKWNVREGILLLHNELFKEYTKKAIANIGDKEQLKQTVFAFAEQAKQTVGQLQATARQALDLIAKSGYSPADFKVAPINFLTKIANGDLAMPSATVANMADAEADAWFTKASKPNADLLEIAARLRPIMQAICDRLPETIALANSRKILLQNYRSFALLNDLYRKSLEICREENTMLLSETKHIIAQFISESDTPFIYEKIGNRFDKYMIDEFQDTSMGEWLNFLPLLRNAMAQSENVSVLLVGDIKQSIYRWRGSDWSILGSMAQEMLGRENTETEPLGGNYRSLPNIVEFNNKVFEEGVAHDNADLNTMLEAAHRQSKISGATFKEMHDALARAYANHTQKAERKCTHKGYIDITLCDDEPDIVARVKSIIDKGYRPSDITILVRWNKEGYEIAQRLLAVKQEGNPRYCFDVMTQEALRINNSPAVRFILAVMHLAVNRRDRLNMAIYNRYRNACNFAAALTDDENSFMDSLRMLSPEEAFEHIAMRYSAELEGQTAYVQALHEAIVKFCANRVADITLFLKWWDENGDKKSVSVERSNSAIEIMTIHKAKGLSNKVVIIPYCDWSLNPKANSGDVPNTIWSVPAKGSGIENKLGSFPVSFNKSVADSVFAESYYKEIVHAHVDAINTLYVALTRAEEQLHIFIPSKALKTGANVGKFLYDILPTNNFAKCDDGTQQYTIGSNDEPEPCKKKDDDRAERVRLNEYTASPVNMRLRLPSERYFDDEQGLSPRDTGIVLHKVFEQASSREDIAAAIGQLVTDGKLSATEAKEITAQVERTLDDSIAGEWFDGKWSIVRCESNIIAPSDKYRRPDRVMIQGKRAVVVDYKFGKPKPDHGRQLGDYAKLLAQMGYDEIKSYLWYIKSGEIIEVGK
ncbi:MAG: UvrD-helicase domain-containing protein [Alistipes sp.]